MWSGEAEATQNDGTRSGPAADLVASGLAASAGVHAGLVPQHLRETPELGVSFVLASGLLLAIATWIALCPGDWRALCSARFLVAGLLIAYLASRTVGIPLLQPEVEHVDALGLSTKAVEVLALLCGIGLGRTVGGRRSPLTQEVAG